MWTLNLWTVKHKEKILTVLNSKKKRGKHHINAGLPKRQKGRGQNFCTKGQKNRAEYAH